MSTGGSNRPSLFSGSDRGAEAAVAPAKGAPARILADMEQRKPPRPRSRRRALPVILISLLGCGLLLGGIAFFSSVGPPAGLSSGGGTSSRPDPVAAGATSAETAGVGGSAVIVDDPDADPLASIGAGGSVMAGDEASAALSSASPAIQGPAQTRAGAARAARRTAGSADRQRSRSAVAGTEPDLLMTLLANIGNNAPSATSTQGGRMPGDRSANAGVGMTAAARSTSPLPDRTRRQGDAARAGEPDLLTTLMGNIGGNRAAGATAVRGQGDSELDVLVSQIQGNRDDNYTPSATALSTIGGNRQGASTAATGAVGARSVQAELRQCPKANTVAGLACRQRICVDHVGNAACPR